MKNRDLRDKFYVAGIDGGGSKTECAIVDQDGRCIGVGKGGPSRETYVGIDKTLESLASAIESASADLAADAQVILTGCTHKLLSHPEVRDLLNQRLGGELRDYTEGEAALGCVGVFQRFGISHIAGTGVATWGYAKDGGEDRVGGWGMLLGDEGGGYDMSVRGLRAAVRALDGRGPATSLLECACRHFGIVCDRASLVEFATTQGSRHTVASFAPEVTAAAEDGDLAAMKIVESAAREHANSIIVLARRLFAPEDEFPVALHGGVATADMVAETLIRLVTREFPKADVRKPVYSPGLGLALFALHDLKRER